MCLAFNGDDWLGMHALHARTFPTAGSRRSAAGSNLTGFLQSTLQISVNFGDATTHIFYCLFCIILQYAGTHIWPTLVN